MSEDAARTLNHFSFFRFTEEYWRLSERARRELTGRLLRGLREAAGKVDLYQVFPAKAGVDFLAWSVVSAGEEEAAARFFSAFARATSPFRAHAVATDALWGFTRPSQYSRGRSAQEIDPFCGERKRYLVVYPFVKTAEWYMMSQEARQGMMNEHIRVGRQYPEITQLLLYSFGVQDQEFVVIYETDDLVKFSDLVSDLRRTEARRFTERDTPLSTAIYHPAEETLALW